MKENNEIEHMEAMELLKQTSKIFEGKCSETIFVTLSNLMVIFIINHVEKSKIDIFLDDFNKLLLFGIIKSEEDNNES